MNQTDVLARVGWLAIAMVVALAYLNGLDAPFVYDDRIEVVGNGTIRDVTEWRAIVGYNVSRMLLVWTYAWNFHSWQLNPTGYHVFSLLVHLGCIGAAISMARALGRLGGHPFPLLAAVIAVGLWAVHPMGVEAVTYITGRSESLCGLLCCAAIAAWAHALLQERDGARGGWYRLMGLVCAVLALLTKEVAGMLPLVLLSMEILLGPRDRTWRRRPRWLWMVPFLALMGLAAWGRLTFAGELLPREVDRTLGVQLTTQTEVWLRYLQLWLVPVGQTLFHHVANLEPLSGRGALFILGWLAVIAGGVRWSRGRPLVRFALLAGALFLIPSSSFVPLKENMAEHRSYQLGLYLSLAIAWSVTAAVRRRWMWGSVILSTVFVGLTVSRNHIWSSEERLWTEATQRGPDVAEAWYGLGDARRFQADFGGAIEAYERAVTLNPAYLDAWNNMGISKAELGDPSGARAAWHSALRQQSSYCKAHRNLGELALEEEDLEEAIVELRTTLVYCPNSTSAHYRLGTIYYNERRNAQRAVYHYEALLRIDPQFSRADEVRERLLQLTW